MKGTSRVPVLLAVLVTVVVLAGDPDDDNDGVPNEQDCRPTDPTLWAPPAAPVTDLVLDRDGTLSLLRWSRPDDLGGVAGAERYDTFASGDPAEFAFPLGYCAEINGTDLTATDARAPSPGESSFYLTRVENDCGKGPLDIDPPPVQPRVPQYREVTNNNDDGAGSLRSAIAASKDGDVICFDVGGTIALTSGSLLTKWNTPVAIAGPGADLLAVDGGGAPFVIGFEAAASISGLTFSGGDVGVYAGPYPTTIALSTIRDNTVGVEIEPVGSTVKISTTTIEGNSSAGLLASYVSSAEITSSTIRNNGIGVATYSEFDFSLIMITSSTIAGNQIGVVSDYSWVDSRNNTIAGNDVGLKTTHQGKVHLFNNIVSNSIDCIEQGGGVSSLLPNVIVDPSCAGPDDLQQDPLLGPLGDHGGPTDTFSLLPGSPAIDAGHCTSVSADQRFFPRPFDQPELPNAVDGCDIGAYEVQSEFACDCQGTADCDFPDTCYAGCVCRYEPFCGSGICDPGEDGVSCPEDCPAVCGNGLVEPGEECEVFQDCGLCPIGQVPVCTDCECDCVPR